MTIPTLWLFLICFRLCGRLLKTKNHVLDLKQEELKTEVEGLDLVIVSEHEKENRKLKKEKSNIPGSLT